MKYRKKPVVIEAFRMGIDNIPDWFMDKVTDRTVTLRSNLPEDVHFECYKESETYCDIQILEGVMRGNYGDYIIKGVNGEFYPCKPDIFAKTYEAVEEN